MNNYTPCPWSKGIVRMTIFVLFALMAGIAIITILYLTAENLDNSDKNQLLFWLGVIIAVIALSLAFAPRSVSADDQKIVLHRYIGKVVILRSEIRSVKRYDPDMPAIRLFGIGGYVGLYRCSQIGNFAAFMTDPSRSYVIYRRSKRPIVITSVEKLQ